MQTGTQGQLAGIIRQLQVLRQQEAVVSNQLKIEGYAEQKRLLLGRYQEIQVQKETLQQHARVLQETIQREKMQGISAPAAPGSPHAGEPAGTYLQNEAKMPAPPPPSQYSDQVPSVPGQEYRAEELDDIFSMSP